MMNVVRTPGDIAANLKPGEAVTIPVEILQAWQNKLHDAFDLGFKAAGGTIIPDDARDMVELSLTREQINALAELAEDSPYSATAEPLARFLETVSIYRSK